VPTWLLFSSLAYNSKPLNVSPFDFGLKLI
jgi:hypothetical protein